MVTAYLPNFSMTR